MGKLTIILLLAASAYAQEAPKLAPAKIQTQPPKQQEQPPMLSPEDNAALVKIAFIKAQLALQEASLIEQLTDKYKAQGYVLRQIGMADFGFIPKPQAPAAPAK